MGSHGAGSCPRFRGMGRDHNHKIKLCSVESVLGSLFFPRGQ